MRGLLEAFGSRHLAGDPNVWRPHTDNLFTVPADAVTVQGRRTWIRLTQSRWEGCRVRVWTDRVTIDGDAATITLRGGDWPLDITDGRRDSSISAQRLWEDRHNPPPPPWSPYAIPARWRDNSPNALIVPAQDVVWDDSRRAYRVTLTKSRWEGLSFLTPGFRVTELSDTETRVMLRARESRVILRGGGTRTVVSAKELWEDRLAPLTEPGESLWTEPWLSLEVAHCHVRFLDTRYGRRGVVTVPRQASTHAGARIWMAERLLHPQPGPWYLWRLPPHRDVTLSLRGGDTAVMPPREFVEWAQEWAMSWPQRTPGIETVDPEFIPPLEEVVIPDDLLDD